MSSGKQLVETTGGTHAVLIPDGAGRAGRAMTGTRTASHGAAMTGAATWTGTAVSGAAALVATRCWQRR